MVTFLSGWELSSRGLGISARRAEWFVRWTQKIADSDAVNMASFEEGQGRIMFVAGALEHERSFLGSLYRFISIHPRDSVRRIPPYVKIILRSAEVCPGLMLKHNAQGLAAGFLSPTVLDHLILGCRHGSLLRSPKTNFPGFSKKGDKPSLVISTLEALAILVSLKLRFGDAADTEDKRVLIVPSVTDNRGNGAA